MVIEILIVFLSLTLLGLLIAHFTGLAWYWVVAITIGILLIYDTIIIQAENNTQENQNDQRRT